MQIASAGSKFTKIIGGLAAFAFLASLVGIWIAIPKKPAVVAETSEIIDIAEIQSAADRGQAAAQCRLGAIYAKGLNVTQSYAMAAKWYQLAADQGQSEAQLALGELYEVGQGVPRNEPEAAMRFRQAAEQGNPGAQYHLAALFVMGKGVTANETEAFKWYRLAAEQGDALSQFNLGMRYYEGRGVAAEPLQAYQWLSLAAAQGIADATQARDTLQKRMSREQITEAKRLVREFVPKTNPPVAP